MVMAYVIILLPLITILARVNYNHLLGSPENFFFLSSSVVLFDLLLSLFRGSFSIPLVIFAHVFVSVVQEKSN
ncbi:hypothetical protein L1887_09335 [Cichorium endivia]|nr:hypothetical protein L1887_09335 [Cichorium endivia]